MLSAFTTAHVVISLVGIGSGFVVVYGLLTAKRLEIWTSVFLISTIATSVTGFFFPFERFLPSHAVGILSLLALSVALFARYSYRLAGAWRLVYVISAVVGLYLNVFVLIAQLFQKVPALEPMAPSQPEPPFLLTQLVIMAFFVVFASAAAIKFRHEPIHAA